MFSVTLVTQRFQQLNIHFTIGVNRTKNQTNKQTNKKWLKGVGTLQPKSVYRATVFSNRKRTNYAHFVSSFKTVVTKPIDILCILTLISYSLLLSGLLLVACAIPGNSSSKAARKTSSTLFARIKSISS